MGLIQAEFDNLNVSQSDYTTFVEAIPFQVYAILAIVMIPLVAFTKKDFSQMKKAETEAAAQEYSFENDMQGQTGKDGQVYGTSNAKPVMVIVPIIVVFATLFITLVPWKHDQRPRYGRIYCKRIKEYEFLGRTGACGHLYLRSLCILLDRKLLGDFRNHDAACDSDGPCVWYSLCDSRGGCFVRRTVWRPLLAYFGYHYPLLYRGRVQSDRPCKNPAAVCLRERGDYICGIYLRWIYQESFGSGAGSRDFAGSDDGLGKNG